MATKKLLIVCDDAGFASVDRGIRALAEATGQPICAEYLVAQPGALERAAAMSSVANVSIGIHFELAGVGDAERVAMAKALRSLNTCLGERADIQAKAAKDAREQLEAFRSALGRDPAHVSTHGDFHLDASGAVMPWWEGTMRELFAGAVPPMQWAHPVVRHNMYSWNLPATARNPRTAEEFRLHLEDQASDVVEFVLHPALPEPEDPSIDMLFDAGMRIRDLDAAIRIVESGCIERAGYDIVPVTSLQR